MKTLPLLKYFEGYEDDSFTFPKKTGYFLIMESEESQFNAKRVNPSDVAFITIGDSNYRVELDAGTDDDVTIFTDEENFIYIVAVNTIIGYVGLQVHDTVHDLPCDGIFLQYDHEIREAGLEEFEEMEPEEILEKLLPYL